MSRKGSINELAQNTFPRLAEEHGILPNYSSAAGSSQLPFISPNGRPPVPSQLQCRNDAPPNGRQRSVRWGNSVHWRKPPKSDTDSSTCMSSPRGTRSSPRGTRSFFSWESSAGGRKSSERNSDKSFATDSIITNSFGADKDILEDKSEERLEETAVRRQFSSSMAGQSLASTTRRASSSLRGAICASGTLTLNGMLGTSMLHRRGSDPGVLPGYLDKLGAEPIEPKAYHLRRHSDIGARMSGMGLAVRGLQLQSVDGTRTVAAVASGSGCSYARANRPKGPAQLPSLQIGTESPKSDFTPRSSSTAKETEAGGCSARGTFKETEAMEGGGLMCKMDSIASKFTMGPDVKKGRVTPGILGAVTHRVPTKPTPLHELRPGNDCQTNSKLPGVMTVLSPTSPKPSQSFKRNNTRYVSADNGNTAEDKVEEEIEPSMDDAETPTLFSLGGHEILKPSTPGRATPIDGKRRLPKLSHASDMPG